jgi:hypothetical protein
MEPQLRKLGLHTSLKRGIVTLDTDHQICKKGDKLTPEQAQLLVNLNFKSYTTLLGYKLVVILSRQINLEDPNLYLSMVQSPLEK